MDIGSIVARPTAVMNDELSKRTLRLILQKHNELQREHPGEIMDRYASRQVGNGTEEAARALDADLHIDKAKRESLAGLRQLWRLNPT